MYFEVLCSSKKEEVIKETVICHGILYCTNKGCLEPELRRNPVSSSSTDPFPDPYSVLRHWNRDTAAVLNFRHILFSLREGKRVPERFRRGNAVSAADQPQKPAKRRKKSTKKPKK
ncbi:hypothetical protein H4R20_001845 [Coemansia guatemalensis]|uniref:Uncharacterized protein n=1 Tax=Coemansia guatemalensis TaxID=2761395 RepID=A0A9W8LVL3_9FUNG|nr:hypothetical protein H4R20_001845 [Coemansia guatemalensis]